MKKLLSVCLAVVLLVSFSSCRKKTAEPVAQAPKTNEAVELKVWNLFDTSDIFKGQIQAYESKYPNVKINYRKFSNIDEYEQLLVNEIAEGEGPDVFAIQNTWVEKHQKKISPFPVGKTTVPMNDQIFADTFFHVATQELIKSGQIYALPLYIDTLALYYNKQIFRDNIPSSDKPAETWEEVKNQTTQITKANNSVERFALSGMAMGRADNISRSLDIFYNLLTQFGVQLFNDANTRAVFANQQGTIEGTGKPFFPFEEALKLYSSFGNPSYKNYSWNDSITAYAKDAKELNPFLKGKVGMISGYSYLYDDLIRMRRQMKSVGETVINEDDIGVVEFPQLLSFAETGKRDSLAHYFPLTVSRNSENADYAWDFIQFLTSQESLVDYYEKTKKPSSRKDLVDEQMVDPLYGVFARQASYSKTLLNESPLEQKFIDDVFMLALEEAIKNKKRLSDIAQRAQNQMNCQIEKQEKLGEVDVNCLEI